MSFKPMPCSDRWSGLVALLVFGLLDYTLVRQVMSRPIDGLTSCWDSARWSSRS